MVLNAGFVEQLGTPIELYQRPASLFVAGFIGSPAMNFAEAKIDAGGRNITISGQTALPLGNGGMPAHGGKNVILGIRPEHLELVADDPDAVPLTTVMVEQLGADTLVHGHFGESKSNLTVRLEGIRNIAAGEILPIRVSPDHLHVFDPVSEKRLSA